jgi:hypothetical protein
MQNRTAVYLGKVAANISKTGFLQSGPGEFTPCPDRVIGADFAPSASRSIRARTHKSKRRAMSFLILEHKKKDRHAAVFFRNPVSGFVQEARLNASRAA